MSDSKEQRQGRIVVLSEEIFEDTISSEGVVLVDCWAGWCRACKDFQPVFQQAAGRHPAHTFATLDTQSEEALVTSLGIEQIPSLVLFRDGLMLFNQAGYFDADGLDDIIAQAESLDMEEVRATIEAEERAAQQAR
jgi:thioredoxin 1